MEKIDEHMKDHLQQWLNTPPAERDYLEGAEMYHLMRPQDKVLYENMKRRPDANKERIEYHLRKHLNIMLDGLTRRQVALLDRESVPAARETIKSAKHNGKRPDHDALPVEIRELYDKNGVVYEKLVEQYNVLLGMENATSCDRYEHLKILVELDTLYRKNWELYDHYTAPEKPSGPAGETEAPMDTVKAVQSARKYISDNLRKLSAGEIKEAKREAVIAKISERVSVILAAGGEFSDDTIAELTKYGISANE